MAQICKFFPSGKCKFGDSCANLHEPTSGARPGVKQSRSLCVFFKRGTCKQGAECKFSHSIPVSEGSPVESNIDHDTIRTIPCNFWLKGHCINGNDCRFSHPDAFKESDGPSALSSASSIHKATISEPSSPLNGREGGHMADEHAWSDGTDGCNDIQQVHPLKTTSPYPFGLPPEETPEEGITTLDLNDSEPDRDEDGIVGIGDIRPENYLLPPSPASSSDLDIDATESTKIPPFPGVLPRGRANNPYCLFFQRGTCNQGAACKYSHSLDGGQNTSNELKSTNDVVRLVTCEFWSEGKCIYGHACRFLHSTTNPIPDDGDEDGSPGLHVPPGGVISTGHEDAAHDDSHFMETHPHPSTTVLAHCHDQLGEDTGETNIDNDSSAIQNTDPSETQVQEVTPHWSEYADPLVDPSVPFCKFYAQARCTQGDLCTFRHSLSVNEYALLFREAQPALWSSQAQRVRAGYTKPVSASNFGICKFYPLGTCRNGDTCTYLHVPPSDLLPPPQEEGETWGSDDGGQPDWDPQVCWEFSKNGYCKRGDDCRYRHELPGSSDQANGEWGPDEGGAFGSWNDAQSPLRPQRAPQVCWEFAKTGYCGRGDGCRYRHEKSEHSERKDNGQGQDEEGGRGLWDNNKQSDRRLPCKYHAQGNCRKGDACGYLHGDQGSVSEDTGGWDDPPVSSWDTKPIDSWAISEVAEEVTPDPSGSGDPPDNSWDTKPIDSWAIPEVTEEVAAKPSEAPAESEETGTASGWPIDDDATWGMAWTASEPELCRFYLKGTCRKGKRCTLSHKDPESSRGNAKAQTTSWDVSKDHHGHFEESFSPRKDLSWNQDGDDQLSLEGPDTNATELVEPHSPDDDEKTWAVPWVNDVNVPDEPPRINAPCLAFGQGYCKWGDACRYLHISPPDPTSQTDGSALDENSSNDQPAEQHLDREPEEATNDWKNEALPREPADVAIKRLMFGCAVQFNTECFPIDIISASDSCRVLLANLSPEVPYDEEFQNDIIGLYGALKDITLDETETAATATLECIEYRKAAEAVAQLDGQTYDSMVVSARLNSVAETRFSSPLVSYSIKISWPAPSTFAWVYYPTITVAKAEENRLSGKLFEGRKLKTEFPRPRPNQLGPFPIKVVNLPASTSTEAVTALCQGCKLVQLGKPLYNTSPTADIHKFLEDAGPLDFLDFLPSDSTNTKITAFAHFKADSSLLSELLSLNGVKQPFIGGAALWVQPVHHVKYIVAQKHLQLIRDEVTQLSDTYKAQCSILLYDLEDPSMVHISAPVGDAAIFGRANVALQTLLHGEIFISNSEMVWDEYFDLTSGAMAVEKLNAKNPYCIMLDNLTRTIRIIGGEKGRQQARSLILRLLAKVRDLRRSVPLDRFTLAILLDGGMQRLIDDLGENKVTLDVGIPALIVRGEVAVHDKVQRFLKSCDASQSRALEEYQSSCVVCYRQPRSPIELSCGHAYCETCLQHVLRPVAGLPFTPPRCIAMAEVTEEEPPGLDLQCTEKIPYAVVRDVLSILDEVSFLRSSFISYIRSHIEDLFFCPTPNCETVYRSRKEHAVYRCPSCSTRVCSICHHEYHAGVTCDERSNIYYELMNARYIHTPE